MTTINLHQNQQGEQNHFSAKNGNRGFIFSLGILVITVLVLVGLKMYIPFAQGKNTALDSEITIKGEQVVGMKSLERVVDLQQRLKEIKTNLSLENKMVTRLEMTQILNHLGSDLSSGVVVSDFKYDADNKIAVTFNANNFSDAAKQILNFKKSEYFSDVDLANIARKENSIECSVTMKIKK